jgi:hypothetical protein
LIEARVSYKSLDFSFIKNKPCIVPFEGKYGLSTIQIRKFHKRIKIRKTNHVLCHLKVNMGCQNDRYCSSLVV